MPDLSTFWSRVDKSGDCWIYNRSFPYKSTPLFTLDGKAWHVNRLSYHLFFGPIPPGHSVWHTCKEVACVNPDHLQLLSSAIKDGQFNPRAKLTSAQVVAIRKEYAKGERSVADIAKDYPVERSALGYIIRGESWKNVGGPIRKAEKRKKHKKLKGDKLPEFSPVNLDWFYALGEIDDEFLEREARGELGEG